MPTTRFSKLKVTRPPTPPLENEDFDIDACETGLELLDSKHLVYNTPDDSPNPTSDIAGKSPEERSAKRVGFALKPSHIEDKRQIDSKLTEVKPRRSILKQFTPISSDPLSSDPVAVEELGFSAMLDQLIRGLASQDISARYDAYMSMNGCLKTYTDVPSRKSLSGSMSVLDNYIRRDLVLDNSAGVKASQTITEALKFVTQLCWFPETKSFMTAGFQVFLLNHTITVLGKEDTSKTLANLYLYFLSVQTFPSRVMNQEKVTRILAVIKSLAGRVQGRQAIAHRLAIYRRLIGQAKSTMVSKANLWMEDLFNNMMSKTKLIRERAIALGFVAGQCCGSEADVGVADAVRKLTNSRKAQSTETKYIDEMVLRLQGWLDSKQNTTDIPAIWSIVILLLRSRPNYPKQWEHLSQWLRLIQGCLNINDTGTRREANLAWIRLIYIIRPEAGTAQSFSNLLFRPMKRQLERQEREKDTTGELRQNVDGAYMTLLYYAFRPGADFETLDRYWDEYVVPVFADKKGLLIEQSLACDIFMSLFGCTQQVWRVDRALDTTSVLTASEIPRLDCKWIRSRAKRIVSVLEKYLSELDPEVTDDSHSWKNVWVAFLSAIKQAGAKEIKVSSETMAAIAELLNVFRRTTTDPHLSILPQGAWIINHLYRQLGFLPFLEERIVGGGENGELIATPISFDRARGDVLSPLNVLLKIMLGWVESSCKATNNWSQLHLSPKQTGYLTTIVGLLHAGFKQLPVHIRHNASGVQYAKTLEELQHAVLDSPSNTSANYQKLYEFASWLYCHGSGVSSSASVDVGPEADAEAISANHNLSTNAIAEERPVQTSSAQIISVVPLEPADSELVKKRSTRNVLITPKATSRRQRGAALQQQPRIRHDNSQIEFASIDSSPSILKAFDSQLLTERQREVKERQNEDNDALFRNISSSSGPKSRTENTPRLQLSGHDRAKVGHERFGSSSPILPPGDSMVAILGSPTPYQRRLSTKDNTIIVSTSTGDTGQLHLALGELSSSPPTRASEILQGPDAVLSQEAMNLPRMEDTHSDTISKKPEKNSGKVPTSLTNGPLHISASPRHLLSSSQVDISAADIRLSSPVQEAFDNRIVQKVHTPVQELKMANGPADLLEMEDDQLISSQFDQDLRLASQDISFAESPKTFEPNQKNSKPIDRTTPPSKGARKGKKRRSLQTEDEVVESESPRKRSKVIDLTEPEHVEVAPASKDLVSELQALLSKARSGLDAKQGLAILQMSAELTQLAVNAIQR